MIVLMIFILTLTAFLTGTLYGIIGVLWLMSRRP